MTIDNPAAAALYGAWTLVTAVVDAGGERHDLYGPTPRGRLIVDPSGFMVALLSSGDDAVSATGAPVTMAYTGRVAIDGNRFVTTVDASSIAAWVGTRQGREFTIDGDRLTIVTARGPHPAFPGADVVGRLEWRREG